MRMVIGLVALGLAVALGSAVGAPAAAQQVEIQTPAPEPQRPPEVIAPGLHYETTRPPDADVYPRGTRVEHDPAFFGGLSARRETPTSTGRIGLAGWTTPNPPVGAAVAGHREVIGYFAIGFAFTWDGPPPPPRRIR
jgi:hypothetical protein